MREEEICYLDIAGLGRGYRDGSLSPVQVTQAALDRIHRLDGPLNAFITVLDERALAEARRAEQELAHGLDRGPLHGVPVSLKDIFDTAGIRTTAASRVWSDRVPAQSATTAARLEAAGAVLLGKCNLLEFAYGIVHPDYGQCNNPWDLKRTAGGSSSGSAASVAAGMGWGSLGTDTGGSIRIPASYCGIVGLKPTYGLVSRAGVGALSWSLDHVGTLARTVQDTALLLGVIAGFDPLDPTTSRAPVPNYAADLDGNVRGLRLGILDEHMGDDLYPGVAGVTQEAIRELERAGMSVRSVRVAALAQADAAMLVAILPEGTVVHRERLRQRPADYAEMTRQQLELGALIPATDYVQVQRYRRQLLDEFMAAFREVDLLANPTVAWEAPAEDPTVAAGEGSAEARRTGPYNLVGLPAVSVPCGFGTQGLPLGLQLAGPPLADALVLKAAHAYEQRTRWHLVRPALQ